MNKAELQFTSKSEVVYKILLERITSGQLEAGKRYKVVELAEELGVSRTPVSEAVKILASQGYVTLLPSVGFEIRQLTFDEIKEILLIRGSLEELAVEMAMERTSPSELREMRALLQKCLEAIDDRNIAGYSQLNENFHFTLYQWANLPKLNEVLKTLWTHEGWYIEELKTHPEEIKKLVHDHYDILTIIEHKENSKIKEVIRRHIVNCQEALASQLHAAGLLNE